jgi:Cysteine-rich secretory protein family
MKKNTLHTKRTQKELKVIGNQRKLEEIQRKNNWSKYISTPSQIYTGSVKNITTSPQTIQKPISTRTSSQNNSSLSYSPLSIPNVDTVRVRTTWLSWYNTTRKSLGRSEYSYDARLDKTASDWNKIFAEGRWLNHHTRTPGDGYYNFPKIDAWFLARWINPKVINRSKHTENVGYGYYTCNQGDCTDELIESIRSTYMFYMSEKGKSYDAHYQSIINPYFTKIGMDIIVVPNEKRYYLTVHYITE